MSLQSSQPWRANAIILKDHYGPPTLPRVGGLPVRPYGVRSRITMVRRHFPELEGKRWVGAYPIAGPIGLAQLVAIGVMCASCLAYGRYR